MKATNELPDDPKLPALQAIRSQGLARAIPQLDLNGSRIELTLCGYSQGTRATLEARTENRRFAVKAYADDPEPEAALYKALAAAGLGGNSGSRVPPLLCWDRTLRVLVIGWLEGPTAHELVSEGRGTRAGELAAQWFRCVSPLTIEAGPALGADMIVKVLFDKAATFDAFAQEFAKSAQSVVDLLARTQPKAGTPRLVHGTLYARHVLDSGDGPGVIDWQRFGQGHAEQDAGMFLATIARVRLDRVKRAAEAARAEEAFLAGTRGVLDEGTLSWYRAAALFQLAERRLNHPERHDPEIWKQRVQALLGEAAKHAQAAG